MQYKISVVIVWLIVFSFACHHPVQEEIIPVSRHLTADTICEYPFSSMGKMILKNGHIFMVDPISAGKMYIYNTQTGQTDYFQTVDPNYLSMADDTEYYPDALLQQLPLSFFHFYVNRYFHYTLENNKVKLTRQNLQPRGGSHITKAEQISEKKYVTLGFFRTGLLGLCDKESKEMKYYGHYPISVDIPFERSAMENIVQSFSGNIAYSGQHSKVVYAGNRFAYLSCYHFTGKKLIFQWEKHIVPLPATQIVDGEIKTDQTVTQGRFSGVAVAGDYIFACYTQKNVTDTVPDVAHSILVYDMNGNHVATYHIDCSISGIMADIEKGALYGFSFEDEPVIVRFQFDQI